MYKEKIQDYEADVKLHQHQMCFLLKLESLVGQLIVTAHQVYPQKELF